MISLTPVTRAVFALRTTLGIAWRVTIAHEADWFCQAQLNSPTNDGQPDENRLFNCGYADLAMILNWFYYQIPAFRFQPDDIHDEEVPNGTTGPCNEHQLADVATNWGLGPVILHPTSQSALNYEVWSSLKTRGMPVTALRFWRWPGDSYLHWVNVIEMTDQTVTIANSEPLDAAGNPISNPTQDQMKQTMSYAEFWALHNTTGHYPITVISYRVSP